MIRHYINKTDLTWSVSFVKKGDLGYFLTFYWVSEAEPGPSSVQGIAAVTVGGTVVPVCEQSNMITLFLIFELSVPKCYQWPIMLFIITSRIVNMQSPQMKQNRLKVIWNKPSYFAIGKI